MKIGIILIQKVWLNRAIASKFSSTFARGKSVLLMGPRQTGKTSLVKQFTHDVYITFMDPVSLQKYESNPGILLS